LTVDIVGILLTVEVLLEHLSEVFVKVRKGHFHTSLFVLVTLFCFHGVRLSEQVMKLQDRLTKVKVLFLAKTPVRSSMSWGGSSFQLKSSSLSLEFSAII